MICVGIDIAKDKHDCFITNSDGEALFNVFTIPNNQEGYNDLYQNQELDAEIEEIENEIKTIIDEVNSPILSISGISYRMGAMIIAEIDDFSRFNSPNKILAYAGLSPSTYQSGQLNNNYSHMEKRGSRYLRYVLFNATKFVCHWDSICSLPCQKTCRGETLQCTVPLGWLGGT